MHYEVLCVHICSMEPLRAPLCPGYGAGSQPSFLGPHARPVQAWEARDVDAKATEAGDLLGVGSAPCSMNIAMTTDLVLVFHASAQQIHSLSDEAPVGLEKLLAEVMQSSICLPLAVPHATGVCAAACLAFMFSCFDICPSQLLQLLLCMLRHPVEDVPKEALGSHGLASTCSGRRCRCQWPFGKLPWAHLSQHMNRSSLLGSHSPASESCSSCRWPGSILLQCPSLPEACTA